MAFTLGIVLAAGESRRLPNKALLPLRDGRPAIMSAIDMVLGIPDIAHVVIVVSPGSIIPKIVKALYPTINTNNMEFVTQLQPKGVMDALGCVIRGMTCAVPYTRAIVTFCDNVYPKNDFIDIDGPSVSTRQVSSTELDFFDNETGLWTSREKSSNARREAIAGWYLLPIDCLLQCGYRDNFLDYLNWIEATPISRAAKGWHDIGTLAAYHKYWDEVV